MDEPILLGPGEGESQERFTILAGREELVLTEFRYAPGQDGPPRHIHRHHADAFYVLDGQLQITLDEEPLVLDPGGFVLIPPEVIHTFGNPGSQPGRYLNLHAPGMGFDEYLRGRLEDFDQVYDVPPGSGRPTSEAILLAPGEGEQLALGLSRAGLKAGGSDGLGLACDSRDDRGAGLPGARPPPPRGDGRQLLRAGRNADVAAGRSDGRGGPGLLRARAAGHPPHLLQPQRRAGALPERHGAGGFERYLQEAAALGGPPDPAKLAEIASKYDFRAV